MKKNSMRLIRQYAATVVLLLGSTSVQAQAVSGQEPEMAEITVSDHADHIFSNFIVGFPSETSEEWKKIFRDDILGRMEQFYAADNLEMDIRLSDCDSLEAGLKALSQFLVTKAERLTAADTTLWQHGYSGERYYFNFSLQVEAIPLEGSSLMSFHLMASEFKPWGERERDFEAWCGYDMATGRKLGLTDMLLPEGIPVLKKHIEQFVTAFYLGDDGSGLLVRDGDGEIALPAQYDVALVPGMLRYSYPKDALVRGRGMDGVVPIELLRDYLTPVARKAADIEQN